MLCRFSFMVVAPAFLVAVSQCQVNSVLDVAHSDTPPRTEDNGQVPSEPKRILGIIPNFRTSPSLDNYKPLTTSEKFSIASQDSFDRGTLALGAIFGAEGQLTNANRSFGQGASGYGKYFGSSYGDLVIGNYMTEAVFPTLLHQDPRYFRRGTGSRRSRLGYAVGRIFLTQRDSGGTQFNYSELIGNSVAVTISNAYYSNNRTAADGISKLGMQLGVDMAANILKEFWPDLQRKFKRRTHVNSMAPGMDVPTR